MCNNIFAHVYKCTNFYNMGKRIGPRLLKLGQWRWFTWPMVVGNLGSHSQKSKRSLKPFKAISTVDTVPLSVLFSENESSCLHGTKLSKCMPDWSTIRKVAGKFECITSHTEAPTLFVVCRKHKLKKYARNWQRQGDKYVRPVYRLTLCSYWALVSVIVCTDMWFWQEYCCSAYVPYGLPTRQDSSSQKHALNSLDAHFLWSDL